MFVMPTIVVLPRPPVDYLRGHGRAYRNAMEWAA
jgi:hypothetical protein